MSYKIIAVSLIVVALVGISLWLAINQTNKQTEQETTISSASVDDKFNPVVMLSDGKSKIVGQSVEFVEKNFADVKNYREAHISPDRMFVAFEGSGFEESFVEIYSLSGDTLYPPIFGQFTQWLSDGRIQIQSCNLAGENCSIQESISDSQPWIMQESTK